MAGLRCHCCNITDNHEGIMKQMLVKAASDRPAVPSDFRQRAVCNVRTPLGFDPYTVETAEQKFVNDFTEWDSTKTNCPPGSIHEDKMANKTPTTRAKDLEEKHRGKQLKDWPKLDRGDFVNRIGDMGEFLSAKAIQKELENQTRPDHPALTVTGFKMFEYLQGTRRRIGDVTPSPENLISEQMFDATTGYQTVLGSTEHDIVTVIPNNDKLEVVFGQVKTIDNITDEIIRKKMTGALEQTRRDAQAFLKILPDISVSEVRFRTLVFLPASEKPTSDLCSRCEQVVVFRSDLRCVI